VDNVVVLTGDVHSSWAADLSQDPNNPDTATGGYNPATGVGSRAVEFITPSVTSPAIIDRGVTKDVVMSINPHFKYVELTRRGYMLLDVDATRVVGEWWYVDTIESRSSGQVFGAAFQVQNAAQRLTPASQTSPRADAPTLAP
jgi:alkaline phosphatase D